MILAGVNAEDKVYLSSAPFPLEKYDGWNNEGRVHSDHEPLESAIEISPAIDETGPFKHYMQQLKTITFVTG